MIAKKSIFRMFSIFFIIMLLQMGVLPVQAESLASPHSASGSFLWAKSMGGTTSDYGNSIAVDSSNNTYTTGGFEGTADFDPNAGTTNLTSAGFDDIFVSKLDDSGNFVWAKSMGGIGYDLGSSVTVDSNGNVYTTGSFEGTADFDPGISIFNLTSAGQSDIFICKLDSSGNFVWAKNLGGTNYDEGYDIAIVSNDSVYTTGYYQSIADFDPGVSTTNLTSLGSYDIFVSKLDSNGNFVWAKSMGGTDYDYSSDIALDQSGNVYTVGGYYSTTADFDPSAGTANLISAGGYDIFVSKLDSNGNFVWVKGMGGLGADYSSGVSFDTNDNVYLTGSYTSTADFDPGASTVNLTSAGNYDIFVSKLDNSGNLLWAKSMGGASEDYANDIAVDSSGKVYTTGRYLLTADFDPGAGTTNLTSVGSFDIFVSKLDNSGNFLWAKNLGGAGYDSAYDIALDSSENVYTTGRYSFTADFDPGAGTANLISVGGYDIFVSKLDNSAIFTDVPFSYWASSYIERLYNAGITGGCLVTPLSYCPDSTVTRAQMAVFLLKGIHGASYTPPAVGVSTGFTDVPTDYWAAAWIKQLAAEGITGGCGPGVYCPDATVTRAQMAVFLLKAKNGSSYSPPAVGVSTGFGDVSIVYWAAPFIKQLVADGITSGCGGGNYCPDSDVTRAQMAVFLVKTFNLP